MTTASQFQHKLDDLDLTALQSSPEKLADAEAQLRQMLQDINREMYIIRNQYGTRITAANAGGSSRVLVSNRQAGSGRRRADQVQKLETERDEKLAPFETQRERVESLLKQMGTDGPASQ